MFCRALCVCFSQRIHFVFPAVSNAAAMPTRRARKLLDLLGADVSGCSRRARMRAMLPRVTIVGYDRGHNREARPILFRNGRQLSLADLLPMVELVIRQIAAACHLEKMASPAILLFGKATACPH